MHAIHHVDVAVYLFLIRFAHNLWLNRLSDFEEQALLFKGGLFFIPFWYFWFEPGPKQRDRRKLILPILASALIALVASRAIADIGPYRVRPVADPSVPHVVYSMEIDRNLENWSAFPSDTATFFFALAFGLAQLSRRWGMVMMIYVSLWVCLPRLFLGEHYLSDVVAGAIIGIAIVWFVLKVPAPWSALATRAVDLADARPAIFYPIALVVSFEMIVLFNDIRAAARTMLSGAQVESFRQHKHLVPIALAAAMLLGLATLLLRRRRRIRIAPNLRASA
jgi:membrane-associated phospholipid phosphatase